MTALLWVLGLAAAFGAASVVALYSYGSFAKKARGAPSQVLPVAQADTPLDRLIAPELERHAGQTGLASVFDNAEAFALRALSARAAGRSIDALYYIWRDDMTGRLLARELIAAADRGVRVRLLLDDINVQGFDPSYLALDGHPRIEVRLFNPIRNRRSALRRGVELVLGLVRFNRRMHCKAWLADGRMALIGGRNVGDPDLGAADGRLRDGRDTDLLVMGPSVQRAGAVFDAYWNSGIALPISALWKDHRTSLPRFRAKLDAEADAESARAYLDAALSGRETAQVLLPADRMAWTAAARIVADPPEKALGTRRDHWMPEAIAPVLEGATDSVRLVTPYFVPGREGLAQLQELAARGVRVEVLTNSLSATNHILVHGAYRRYRRPLLAAGIALHEYAPTPGPSGVERMLHTKCLLVDGCTGFVGSFNFDLRSAFLNTEMGVLFDAPTLVAELSAEIDHDSAAAQAHSLSLQRGKLIWSQGGLPAPMTHEPGAPALRRGLSWMIGHLPIHSYL